VKKKTNKNLPCSVPWTNHYIAAPTAYRIILPFWAVQHAGGWGWTGPYALDVPVAGGNRTFWLTEQRGHESVAPGRYFGAFDRGRSSSPYVFDFDVQTAAAVSKLGLRCLEPSGLSKTRQFAALLNSYAYLIELANGTALQLIPTTTGTAEVQVSPQAFQPDLLDFIIDLEATSGPTQATELALIRFQGTHGFFEAYITTRDNTAHVPGLVSSFLSRSDSWPDLEHGPVFRRRILYRGTTASFIGKIQSVTITLVADSRPDQAWDTGMQYSALVHEVMIVQAVTSMTVTVDGKVKPVNWPQYTGPSKLAYYSGVPNQPAPLTKLTPAVVKVTSNFEFPI
jgi:hypothetical protein